MFRIVYTHSERDDEMFYSVDEAKKRVFEVYELACIKSPKEQLMYYFLGDLGLYPVH